MFHRLNERERLRNGTLSASEQPMDTIGRGLVLQTGATGPEGTGRERLSSNLVRRADRGIERPSHPRSLRPRNPHPPAPAPALQERASNVSPLACGAGEGGWGGEGKRAG